MNTVSCTNNVLSNVVTITVGSGSAPSLTVTLTNTVTSNQVTSGAVCDGEGIIVDASGSTGDGYEFILNSVTVQGPSSVSSYTFPAFSNGDTIQVRVFETLMVQVALLITSKQLLIVFQVITGLIPQIKKFVLKVTQL